MFGFWLPPFVPSSSVGPCTCLQCIYLCRVSYVRTYCMVLDLNVRFLGTLLPSFFPFSSISPLSSNSFARCISLRLWLTRGASITQFDYGAKYDELSGIRPGRTEEGQSPEGSKILSSRLRSPRGSLVRSLVIIRSDPSSGNILYSRGSCLWSSRLSGSNTNHSKDFIL